MEVMRKNNLKMSQFENLKIMNPFLKLPGYIFKFSNFQISTLVHETICNTGKSIGQQHEDE
jgi:hypothetical protein